MFVFLTIERPNRCKTRIGQNYTSSVIQYGCTYRGYTKGTFQLGCAFSFIILCIICGGNKVANNMKLIDILDRQKHSYLLQEYEYDMNYQPIDKTSYKGRNERLSVSELEELMDVNRQTYKRVNGRVRRK